MFNRRQTIVSLGLAACMPEAFAREATLPLLLAQNYQPGVDVSQYWVSEKLDGVRALWDGKALVFRSGKPIAAPDWFTAKLPPTALDGELWMGRGSFDALSGAVRKTKAQEEDWQRIQYMVFEQPGGAGDFTERGERLQSLINAVAWPQLQWVAQWRTPSEAELQYKLTQVVTDGGEGLMLHLASAPYTTGRSSNLLKLKSEPDAEGVVVAHLPGRGKYQGQLGALVLKTEDGQRFRIGTGLTDALRRKPPPIGSTITYTYRGLTPSGIPRFASFLRVREDL
jgi:DNA ligase 1